MPFVTQASQSLMISTHRAGTFRRQFSVDHFLYKDDIRIAESVLLEHRKQIVNFEEMVEHHDGGAFVAPTWFRVQHVDERMFEEMREGTVAQVVAKAWRSTMVNLTNQNLSQFLSKTTLNRSEDLILAYQRFERRGHLHPWCSIPADESEDSWPIHPPSNRRRRYVRTGYETHLEDECQVRLDTREASCSHRWPEMTSRRAYLEIRGRLSPVVWDSWVFGTGECP